MVKKNPEISCIIITLNEEKYLPIILKSLKEQTFQDFEIIVADFNSKDKTMEIALKAGCNVVIGGKASFARNSGARVARGKYLVFLDADGLLKDKNFLKLNLEKFKKSKAGAASVYVKPIGPRCADKISFGIYNIWTRIMKNFSPYGTGACIFIRRDIFDKIGGFNEKVIFAEDHEILKRASKYKFTILPIEIYTSIRRMKGDGRLLTFMRYLYVLFYRTVHGEVKNDLFNYQDYRTQEHEK
jgi:glycosyltransferase involved in cell wall biosynthesis